ncbi:MAG TPA: DUF1345 domain-containing protein [Methylomirabilota bacterium]
MDAKAQGVGGRASLVRIVRARPRLFSSAAVGIAVALALTVATHWRPATRVLLGWDVGVALYLIFMFETMASADVHTMRRHAAEQDEGRHTMLVLTLAAAVASVVAIFAELGGVGGAGANRQPLALVLATATIVLSWTFIHSIFALHYAHEFYDEDGGGMAFPGGDVEPDYWDFVYFAFVIGMTSQVSDVGITSKHVRRTVAAHGILSFMFNTTLLALVVNIAAGVI